MKLSEQFSDKMNCLELLTARPRAEQKINKAKANRSAMNWNRREWERRKRENYVKIRERRVYNNVGVTGEPVTRYLSPAVAGHDCDTCAKETVMISRWEICSRFETGLLTWLAVIGR